MNWPNIDGCEFYLCGGAVRDYIIGRENKDMDFVVITKFAFQELVNILEVAGYEMFEVKPEFLTIRCKMPQGEVIDIAFPRSESTYKDNRRPTVVKRAETLKEDSMRRDFTMNSMYMNKEGEIIDYHGGEGDINENRIVCVGSPQERMIEDYLRILRAIRFSCQLGFVLEHELERVIDGYKNNLKSASAERVREEINKALKANARCLLDSIEIYQLYDILEHLGLRFELTAKK